MEQGICYLIGAGTDTGLDFAPSAGDYVIAVDGGLRYLEKAGISPDLIIGDFDTLGYCPKGPNVIRLDTVKDDTDTLAALREGIRRGYSVFHLYGGTGGRIDHTIANLQLLAFLSREGRQGILHEGETVLTAITEGTLLLPPREAGYLSVFAYTDQAEGVSLQGLKYELTDACLSNTFPLGTSNEFVGTESSISVRKGTLLVVLPGDMAGQILTGNAAVRK